MAGAQDVRLFGDFAHDARQLSRPLATIVALAAIALVPLRHSVCRPDAIVSFAAAASTEVRELEPRLCGGFRWAPLRRATAARRWDGGDYALASAIANTLDIVNGHTSDDAQHAAGVARLLAGDEHAALVKLAAAAQSANDARRWSDLAAATYVNVVSHSAPELLGDALAAADKALSLSPDLPEALFNRALIIERLGLRDDARAAWNRYALTDSDPQWIAEGREHLVRLGVERSFRDILARDYARLTSDSSAARSLARRFPQEARTWGETEILGRWSAAEMANDHVAAEPPLRLARWLGEELLLINGDRMLQEAVAAIDAAEGPARASLAAAHADFRNAQKVFREGRPADAEALFGRAVDELDRGGSPVAYVARYFVANTQYEQGRRAEALTALDRLLIETPPRFRACRAQLLWQAGVCHASRAEWGAAIANLDASVAIFDELGESDYAATVRHVLAAVHDRTGDPTEAWKHRMVALHGLGQRTDYRLQKALASVGEAAMLRANWSTAASFLTIEIEIGRRIRNDALLAEALLLRAAARERAHDTTAARDDVAEARVIVARVADPAYRQQIHADLLMTEAMLTASPSEATSLLTEAITFQSAKGDRMDLPHLFLERGRALRRLGDVAAAAADVERGIAELESHRQSLPQGEARWGAFYGGEELFEEAIELALNSDDDLAFAASERARARSLLESYDRPPALDRRSLRSGTVVVEYAVLPSQLVIFVVDAGGVRARPTSCDRATLRKEVDELASALRGNNAAAAHLSASKLYRRLITPIAAELAGARTIVIVPDAAVDTVPFAALIDERGKYLIEAYSVVVAPSAAVFAAVDGRRRSFGPPRIALLITSDRDAGLPSVAIEAKRVAGAYEDAVWLQGHDDLVSLAKAADAIHFGGHAIGDDSGLDPASIIFRDERDREHRLGVSDIAALRLRRTSVVVLAGCNTARGERRGPEGVISVAHGFLAAGVPSVIATLWPIDDAAAAELFPRIHALLAAGQAPADALRAVQLEWIHRPNAPTSLWAALQVIGS